MKLSFIQECLKYVNLTELMRATKWSKQYDIEDVVKLINAGVDVNEKNICGMTALMYAAWYSATTSTEATVKILIDAGADVNVKDNKGWTALMHAARWSSHYSSEGTVKILIDAGADVNIKDNNGQTALMFAAHLSKINSTDDTVKLLIDAGADVNATDFGKRTALMHAVKSSNRNSTEGAIKLLIDAGANVNKIYKYKYVHTDKHKILYECIILPRKIAFGIGCFDTGSIVSTLPREIFKVILDFVDG